MADETRTTETTPQRLFKRSGDDIIVSARDRLTHLAFFRRFVSMLDDVDEGTDEAYEPYQPGDPDWVNRLGWAWDALGEFAERMGPDFFKEANRNGRLNPRADGTEVQS